MNKENAHRGERWADVIRSWQAAVSAHYSIPTKSTWQHLADLAGKAVMLAETDPDIEQRARYDRLARYLAQRIARSILREVGRR